MTWLERIVMALLEAAAMLGAAVGAWLVFSSLDEPPVAMSGACLAALAMTLIPLGLSILAHNNIMRRMAAHPLDQG